MIAARIVVTIAGILSTLWVAYVAFALLALEITVFGHIRSAVVGVVLAAVWSGATVYLTRRSWTAPGVGAAWSWGAPLLLTPGFFHLWQLVAWFAV